MRRATTHPVTVFICIIISIHALLAESDFIAPLIFNDQPRFLSTLSLRRATAKMGAEGGVVNISIHALLAESDRCRIAAWGAAANFYPRSPCGERPLSWVLHCAGVIFLSTLSLRRATCRVKRSYPSLRFLSTLSLRRATVVLHIVGGAGKFLSTLSLRRATGYQQPCGHPTRDFYPRSPCGERRNVSNFTGKTKTNFYPRSPCGERRPTQQEKHQ